MTIGPSDWDLLRTFTVRSNPGVSGSTKLHVTFEGGGYWQASSSPLARDPLPFEIPVKVGESASVPDINLATELERVLGLRVRVGDPILKSELAGLTSLRLENRGIRDLTGLEHATGLRELLIPRNGSLRNDLSALSGLTQLTELDLSYDALLTDLSALSGLTNLETLRAVGNDISSTAGLTNMRSLRHLDLRNNTIANIGDLAANTGLGSGDTVDLRGNSNTLKWQAYEHHIPALQNRGVTVQFDPRRTVTVSPTTLAIDSTSPNAADRRVTLTYTLDLQPASSQADPNQIGQVLVDRSTHNRQIARIIERKVDPVLGSSWDVPQTITLEAPQGVSGSTTAELIFYNGGYDIGTQVPVRVGVGVHIPDSTLRAALEMALGKVPGQLILRSEMAELTRLSSRNQTIADLTGLEYATGLTDLDLPRNNLGNVDLSPISGLTSLTRLNLNGNGISDLSQLSDLTALQRLELVENPVTDLSPLQNLTSLEQLFLRDDDGNGLIVDIEALVANTGLGSGDTLDLRGNPLSHAYATQIPALQARGVDVQFDLDERPTVTISPIAVTIDSVSAIATQRQGTFTYVLDAEPTGDVAVSFEVRNSEVALELEPGTPTAWNVPRTVRLQAEEQGVSGSAIVDITFSGGGYDGVVARVPVQVTAGVNIPDPTLRTELERALGKDRGEPILAPELAELTELDIRNQTITDLTGLEHATGLTKLLLPRNGLGSVDLSPLSRLTSLTHLDLNGNGISDISALSGLTALERLVLGANAIADLSPLRNLTAIQTLFLRFNQIADITPLVANRGLSSGDVLSLRDNAPLNRAAYEEHIPALEARGVEVRVDPNPSVTLSRTALTLDTSPASSRDRRQAFTYVLDSEPTGPVRTSITIASPDVQLLTGGVTFHPTGGNGRVAWNQAQTVLVQALRNRSGSTTITLDFSGGGYDRREVIAVSYEPGAVAVSIPDPNLRTELEGELSKSAGDPILRSELATLTSLALNDLSIADLTGLERAIGLTELSLRNNRIADIGPLVFNAGLGTGDTVDLRGNAATLNQAVYDTQIPALRNRGVTVQFDPVASIPDVNLRAALERELGKSEGDPPILEAELAPLTSLTLNNLSITDLTGLELATSLTELNLNNNNISDLSALSVLTGLERLHLADNEITDLSALSGLTSLKRLFLGHNRVTDIAPLANNTGLGSGDAIDLRGNTLNGAAYDTHIPTLQLRDVRVWFGPDQRPGGIVVPDASLRTALESELGKSAGEPILRSELAALTSLTLNGLSITNLVGLESVANLTELNLDNNNISDLSALSGLPSLRQLSLAQNRIRDLAPLVNNAGLGSGDDIDLRGNLMNRAAYQSQIPALQARGVRVQSSEVDPSSLVTVLTPTVLISTDEGRLGTYSLSFKLNSQPSGGVRVTFLSRNQLIADDSVLDPINIPANVNIDTAVFRGDVLSDGVPGTTIIDISFSGGGYDGVTAQVEVEAIRGSIYPSIPDPILLSALERAIGKNPGEGVSYLELAQLTELDIRNQADFTDLTGLEHATSLTRLLLPRNGLTDISALSGLTALTQLELPGNNITDLTPLSGLTNLQKLVLGYNAIRDISPLRDLTAIEALYLRNNQIVDITPLVENTGLSSGDILSLRENATLNVAAYDTHTPALQARGVEVRLETNISIPDPILRTALERALGKNPGEAISHSELARLTELDIRNQGAFTDLTGLQYATGLTKLLLPRNGLRDLSALSGLTALTQLELPGNNITDLTPLSGLTNLRRLVLGYNAITNISPLRNLTAIEALYLRSNRIIDITPLVENTGLGSGDVLSLRENGTLNVAAYETHIPALVARGVEVRLQPNPIPIPDPILRTALEVALGKNPGEAILRPELAALTELDIRNQASFTDLTGLEYATGLTKLLLPRNGLRDISALSGLTALTQLELPGNNISDITPLSGLTNLRRLVLGYNAITDLTPLRNLTAIESLFLRNNQIVNITPLLANTGLSSGDVLSLYENGTLSVDAYATHIPGLVARGVDVRVEPNPRNFSVRVTRPRLQLAENGGTGTYSVFLSHRPGDGETVIVTPRSNDPTVARIVTPTEPVPTEGTPTEPTLELTFTSSNWDTPQEVTLEAVDNQSSDDPARTTTIGHTTESSNAGSQYDDLPVSQVEQVTVIATDDDTAGITVADFSATTAGNLVVPQDGGTATYTIVLTNLPSGTVTVTPTSSDTDVATVSGALTFTPDNWDVAQTVTVTGGDDDATAKDRAATISHRIEGGGYRSVTVADVEVTVSELRVRVTPATLELAESGGTATYSISLSRQPSEGETVIITPTSDDPTVARIVTSTEATLELIFSASNWNVPQEVTLEAVDNQSSDDPARTTTISHTTESTNPGSEYDELPASRVDQLTVTAIDDDTAGVTVAGFSATTEEGNLMVLQDGGTASYTVVLTNLPSGTVTVTPTSSDADAVTVSDALTFTPDNWNVAQTVTVVGGDDDLAAEDRAAAISHTIEGGGYGSVTVADVEVTISEFRVRVTPATLQLAENGGTATYSVSLSHQPSAGETVIVTPASDDPTVARIATPTEGTLELTFTSTNWNTPQEVTLEGVDNESSDDPARTTTISHATESTDADSAYDQLPATQVDQLTVTATDDDTPGVTVADFSVMTAEGDLRVLQDGGTATYTIVLTNLPSSTVTVTPTSSDTDLVTVSDALTFTPDDWDVAQTVTVVGGDDGPAAEDRAATISHTIEGGGYGSVTVADVEVAVSELRVRVTPATLELAENGGTAAYTVSLSHQPRDGETVIVTPRSDDPTVARIVTPTETTPTEETLELTFTSTNWNTAQEVTLEGVDNQSSDGAPRTTTISHTIESTNADSGYDELPASRVDELTVTAIDNDTPGVTIAGFSATTAEGALMVLEDAGTASYTIVLTNLPSGTVTVTPTSSNTDVVTVSDALTFTPDDWDVAQTVTVVGGDDDATAQDRAATISHTIEGGGYDSATVADVEVTITNNDAAVSIPDAALRTALESVLSKSVGEPIAIPELAGLTTLNISNNPNISDLTGLEHATGLTNLDLARSNISDISALSGLSALTELDLNGNRISDLTPLSGLTTLRRLVLDSNNITDIAPLTSLTGIQTLFLRNNRIADIAPLVANTGLGSGDVVSLHQNGTLNAAAYATHIPALRARGVEVQTNELPVTVAGFSETTAAGRLMVAEDGGTATYTVVLTSQPSGTVTVTPTSSDRNAVTASNALTFTQDNWDTEQTVTVTGANDTLPSGDREATIRNRMQGGGYDSMSVADVEVSISDNDSGVLIPDANLRAALESALGKSAGDPMMAEELAGLTSLRVNGRSIANLAGLEHATGLTELAIARNGLSDISALSGLTALTVLDLNGNRISDLTPLSRLTALRRLVLGSNDITDISPLRNLTAIQTLFMANNRIAEIGPLVANSGLGSGDVVSLRRNGTLNAAAHGSHIPALRSRGVEVRVEPLSITVKDFSETTDAGRLAVTEDGGTATYVIVLTSQPSGDVTVTPRSSDPDLVTVSGALTFTPDNWDSEQTVTLTGGDDTVPNGYREATISHTVAGEGYGSESIADVKVAIRDNDPGVFIPDGNLRTVLESVLAKGAGEVILPSELETLTSLRANNRSITSLTGLEQATGLTELFLGRNNISDISALSSLTALTSLNLTANSISDFSVLSGLTMLEKIQLRETDISDISVLVANSGLGAGDIIDLRSSTLDGAAYDTHIPALRSRGVTVQFDADPRPGTVRVTPSTLDLAENGGSATYTVALGRRPSAAVTVTPRSGDPTVVTVAAPTTGLIFTPDNWSVEQEVTLEGVDNLIDDEVDRTTTISHRTASSERSYNQIPADQVDELTVIATNDNDTAEVTVTDFSATTTEGHLMVSEDGATATYTIVLNSQPTGNVIVTPTSSDGDVVTVSDALTFTAEDWNTPQTVTVTGGDDAVVGGHRAATISHTVAGGGYDAVTVATVEVTAIDNDTPGVVITNLSATTEAGHLRVEEDGGTASYMIVLTSPPIGNVIVTPGSSDSDVVTVSDALTFTPDDWDVEQLVTVTAGDSAIDTGDRVVTISHTIAGDLYDSVTVPDVQVTAINNEFLGVTIGDFSAVRGGDGLIVNEDGATATYTVVLDSQPTGNVIVTPGSSDSDVVTVSNALTFTPNNWNVKQRVTVTGANHVVDSGDRQATISHRIEGGGYDAVTVADVRATAIDNDTVGVTLGIADPSQQVLVGTNVQGIRNVASGSEAERPLRRGSPLLIEEDHGLATYTIRLNSQPTDTVTVTLRSSNTDVVTVLDPNGARLTFTPDDWSTPKTVTLRAENGAVANGGEATISHRIEGGDYDAVTVRDVRVAAIDRTRVTISAPRIVSNRPFDVTVTFSRPVTGFRASHLVDIHHSRTTIEMKSSGGRSGGSGGENAKTVFVLTVTPFRQLLQSAVVLTVAEDVVPEGNRSARLDLLLNVDHQPLRIGGPSLPVRPVNGAFRIEIFADDHFSFQDFGPEDLTVVNGTVASGPSRAGRRGNKVTYAATIRPDADATLVTVRIPENTLTGAGGNRSPASNLLTVSLPAANAGPDQVVLGGVTVMLDGSGSAAPQGRTLTRYRWIAPRGIALRQCDQTGRSPLGVPIFRCDPTAATPRFKAPEQLTADRDLTFSLRVTDDVGNMSPIDTVTVRVAAPTRVTFTTTDGLAEPPTVSTTATFNNPVTGFDASDIRVSNGRVTQFRDTGNSRVFEITITPERSGPVTVAVDADAATGGVANVGTLEFPETTIAMVNFGTPTPVISLAEGVATPVNRTFDVDINFTAGAGGPATQVTGFDADDLTVSNGTLGNGSRLKLRVDGDTVATYTATIVPDVGFTGTVMVGVNAGAAMNLARTGSPPSGVPSVAAQLPVTIVSPTTVTPTSLAIAEGRTGRYTITLTSRPSGDVTLTPIGVEGVVRVSGPLTFTPSNWSTPQTVTVTGLHDAIASGSNRPATITHTLAGGGYGNVATPEVGVTVGDNDIGGITLSTTTLEFMESSMSSYTLRLNTPPTGDVLVMPRSNAEDVAIVSGPLTFTPSNWSIPQTVTVTGVDDVVDNDPVRTTTISHSFSGGGYDTVTAPSVTVTALDDDTAGITLSRTRLTLAEASGTQTYTVRLNTEPTGDVVVTPTSNTPAAAQVSTSGSTPSPSAELTFTPSNWNQPQTVTVTGVDDDINNDPDRTATISHTISGGGYAAVPVGTVAVTANDDDKGIILSRTGTLRLPQRGTDSYTVRLDSLPTDDVTVSIQKDIDGNDFTLNPTELTFTIDNWNQPQTVTVTAETDQLNVSGTVTHSASGGGYNSVNSESSLEVSLFSRHNTELRQVILSATRLDMLSGQIQTYTVNLSDRPQPQVNSAGEPTGDGTVTLHFGNQEGRSDDGLMFIRSSLDSAAYAPLTFTTENWWQPQTLYVIADDHSGVTPDRTDTISHWTSGGGYDTRSELEVRAIGNTSDGVGITLSTGAMEFPESSVGIYTVRLNTQPIGNVQVTPISSDPTVATIPFGALTFTPTNWNQPQTVTVAGVDDTTDDDLARTIAVTHRLVGRGYDNVTAPPVRVTVTDTVTAIEDDVPRLLVAPNGDDISRAYDAPLSHNNELSLRVTEGETVTYVVGLSSEARDAQGDPVAVTVTATSTDPTAARVAPTQLNINGGAPIEGPYTFTVTLPDNDIDHGPDRTVFISHRTGSSDSNYDNLSQERAGSVRLIVADNDEAGVTAAPALPLTVAEGEEVTYTLVLNTEPTSNVTIVPETSDSTVAIAPRPVVFTPANWNQPQTITVRGVDDGGALNPAPRTATITHRIVGGGYDSVVVDPMTVSVTDDDIGVITLSDARLSMAEASGTSEYTVVLDKQPTSEITVTVESRDLTVATVSPPTLSFNPDNWDQPQTVTVTGIDDSLVNSPDRSTTVTHMASGSHHNDVEVGELTAIAVDDDATVTVTQPSLTITEGTTETYSIVLNNQPAGEVTITPTSDNPVVTMSPTSLSFDGTDWNTPKDLTVTWQDNDVLNIGSRTATISHGITGGGYGNTEVAAVTVTAIEEDVAMVIVQPAALSVDEAGGRTEYTIVLNKKPTGDVTVVIESGDTTVATVSAPSLTFNNLTGEVGAWNIAQTVTVTGVNDPLHNSPNRSTTVTHTASGGDYDNLQAVNLTVTAIDNHTHGLIVTPTTLLLNEGDGPGDAGTETYTISLNAAPSPNSTVTVTPTLTDGTRALVTVAPTSLDFNASNWRQAQTVTLRTKPNAIDSRTSIHDRLNGLQSGTISHSTASTDSSSAFNGLTNLAPITVNVREDDEAGVMFKRFDNPTIPLNYGNGLTAALGQSESYLVKLTSDPVHSVTITPSASNGITVSPSTLTFTGGQDGNWNVPQTVAIVGSNLGRSSIIHRLSFPGTTSTIYESLDQSVREDGETATTVSVTVAANPNGVGPILLALSDTDLTLDEGDQTSYLVSLTSQPSGDVTVMPMSWNTGIAQVSGTLTFTPSDWSQPQRVTVTGIDDNLVNDPARRTTSISHSLSGSGYDRTAGGEVTVTVVDTAPDVALRQDFESSSADTAVFRLTASPPPTTDLQVMVMVNAVRVGSGGTNAQSPSGETSTQMLSASAQGFGVRKDWDRHDHYLVAALPNQPVGYLKRPGQTRIRVSKGQNTITIPAGQGSVELVVEQVENMRVVTSIPLDETAEYRCQWDHEVIMEPSVAMSTQTLRVGENGESESYTVALNLRPTGKVTVMPRSSDERVATVSGPLTFNPDNWDQPQRVTVTGVDDAIDNDPDRSATILHEVQGGGYDGVTIAPVVVTTADNETAGATVTPTTLTVDEAGGTGTYTIVLTSQPTGDVTVTPASGDGTVATVSGPLTFTASNWDQPQTVTVTGVDDNALNDPDRTTRISHTIAGGGYDGVGVDDVAITVVDDEEDLAVSIRAIESSVTEGEPVEFELTAVPAPTTDLVVAIAVTDPNEVLVDTAPTEVTIPANQTTALVELETDDDEVDELDATVTITLEAATNANYTVAEAPDNSASVTVTDNDGLTQERRQEGIEHALGAFGRATGWDLVETIRDRSRTTGGQGQAFEITNLPSFGSSGIERPRPTSLELFELLERDAEVRVTFNPQVAQGSGSESSGKSPLLRAWLKANRTDLRSDPFEGRTQEGGVTTGRLGVDVAYDSGWLVGSVFSWHDGDIEFDDSTFSTEGEVDIELFSINPYVSFTKGRLHLWGTIGGGLGTLSYEDSPTDDPTSTSSDLRMLTAAAGAEYEFGRLGPFDLKGRGEGVIVNLKADDSSHALVGYDDIGVTVYGARGELELGLPVNFDSRQTEFRPYVFTGLRQDGGLGNDLALEYGGGFALRTGSLVAEGSIRSQFGSEGDAVKLTGYSISLAYDRGNDRKGLVAKVEQSAGPSGYDPYGVGALSSFAGETATRFHLGYGISWDEQLLRPFVEMDWQESQRSGLDIGLEYQYRGGSASLGYNNGELNLGFRFQKLF